MSIYAEHITIVVPDSTEMQVFIAVPDGEGPFPGLILFQEAYGVNHHIQDVAKRFAREGYIVIAPEIFHRSAEPGFEVPYSNFNLVAPHYSAITNEGIIADSQACYNWLQQHEDINTDHIATIGYCLGGRASFIANSALPLKAAVAYYGGGIDKQLHLTPNLHAPMLFCWGGLDQHITHDKVEAINASMMENNKPNAVVTFSYADHAFFCDERPNYNPQAAHEAWPLTLAFLQQKLH